MDKQNNQQENSENLIDALDKIDFSNIDVLVKFYQKKLSTKSKPFLQNFAFVGLVSISVQSDPSPRENPKFSTSYHQEIKEFNRNSFGEKFLWILKIDGFNISRSAIHTENETFEFGTGGGGININFNRPS
ncbi:hypothetical protein [Sphaerospermopsis torques-reginae]|uniref:Uncharacterized protein n=1 Tax=Sphaerospermopsis torques-reginae ITEP-024 TaxID=984208 RepID=A0ABX8X5K4_9CYAN|nr:hypothetical protein [Sphaerospermopsis torques-reginae]QYX33955.1 hypothetical protein K2F26_12000 [Sphaerospermopsis torques-reginae ITEP-024]